MFALIAILVFSALISLPMFYIITRRVFPLGSKRKALYIAVTLTVLLVAIFAISLLKIS